MRIVIIGAVAAGMSAAMKLKRLDENYEIIVLEKDTEVSFAACGLPYYISDINPDINELFVRSVEEFREAGIDLRIEHEVTAVDFKKKTVSGVAKGKNFSVKYDKLIIASGAKPIMPDFENKDLKGIYVLKRPSDAREIKQALEGVKHVTIIGAGYIGLELTEAFLHVNKQVSIIERSERVITVYDQEITDMLEISLRENVELRLEESVIAFKGKDRVKAVVTEKGEYPTDMVIVSIGFVPNIDFLGKKLKRNNRGFILVNDRLETSQKDVYAVGDCASKKHRVSGEDTSIALGTSANKQGKRVAEVIHGLDVSFPGILGTNMIRVCQWEMGMTGLNETELKELQWNYGVSFVKSVNHAGYYPGSTPIWCKLLYDRDTRKILGGQLFGENGAGLRVNLLAIAIWNGMTVEELEFADLGYAPPIAAVWDVVQIASAQAK